MDLQRIRDSLTPDSRIDLDDAWRRYRGGGGLEDEAAFEAWLAAQYPHAFDANRTRVEAPVEVSRVLPARFATAQFDAPTVLSERTETSAAASLLVSAMLSDYRQHATALAAQLPFANVLAPGWAPQAQAWLARHAPDAVTWSIESHMGFWEYPSAFNRRLLTFLRSADATARSTS